MKSLPVWGKKLGNPAHFHWLLHRERCCIVGCCCFWLVGAAVSGEEDESSRWRDVRQDVTSSEAGMVQWSN